jgi:hypothetical protein
MGMYTEMVLKCEVSTDLQAEEVLQYLFNDGDFPSSIPDHDFFNCSRWEGIGKSCSYYHVPFATSGYREGYIFSRSDLKNYEDEIAKFIDWLSPYIVRPGRTCIGWSWYEEDAEPTLIHVE